MHDHCSVTGCENRTRLIRTLCQLHYRRWRRHGNPLVAQSRTAFRSWHHVQITDTCWLWTGPLTPSGYAANVAHRGIYQRLIGPVPDGLELDHLCRVRHCVRPDHLEPVTRAENVRRAHAAAREEPTA